MTSEAIEAFEQLKYLMTTIPVLIKVDYELAKSIYPRPQKSDEGLLVVGVDSTWSGSGLTVSQLQEGQK